MDIKNKINITPLICRGEKFDFLPQRNLRKERDIWYKIKLIYSVLIKKISSLLSVDYYKSNNENQFKDIQLQLHATKVTNPYTFNITKDISFSAKCASESTDITITVGNYYRQLSHGTIAVYYGYDNNVIAPISFGTCSPSTYKGIEIGSITIHFYEDEGGGYIRQVFLGIVFSKHVDISKVIIDNTIFNTTASMHTDDSNQVCSYQFNLEDDEKFVDYFINNDGKQITITLE